MSRFSVLLAYKHVLLRQALRAVLATLPGIGEVYECGDGKEAIDLAERYRPDVVVLDSQLPIVAGVEATEHIRRRSPRSRVIVLTLAVDDDSVLEILRAGAAGCLHKEAGVDELITAVTVIQRGGSYLSPGIEQRLVRSYVQRSSGAVPERATRDKLSLREREILQLVAEGRGNQEIARQLVVSVKTVEAHKANISRKLNIRGRTEMIKYAIRKGLIDLESDVRRTEAAVGV